MQIGTRAIARIHKSLVSKDAKRLLVRIVTVMLEERSAVPGKTEHFEIALYRIDITRLRSLAIQILDAQHDFAALGFGDEPCNKRSVDVARMHTSGWRRGETPDDL